MVKPRVFQEGDLVLKLLIMLWKAMHPNFHQSGKDPMRLWKSNQAGLASWKISLLIKIFLPLIVSLWKNISYDYLCMCLDNIPLSGDLSYLINIWAVYLYVFYVYTANNWSVQNFSYNLIFGHLIIELLQGYSKVLKTKVTDDAS